MRKKVLALFIGISMIAGSAGAVLADDGLVEKAAVQASAAEERPSEASDELMAFDEITEEPDASEQILAPSDPASDSTIIASEQIPDSMTERGINSIAGTIQKNVKSSPAKLSSVTVKRKKTIQIGKVTKPKGTSISKLTAGNKAITVRWKKQTKGTDGYQIQYATNRSFTKNKKSVTVSGAKKTSKKISGLKAGKTYYVRIRTYKTAAGVKYYSGWSKAKNVRINQNSWKKLYYNYLLQHMNDYVSFKLIYLNNDNIPELVCSEGSYFAAGADVFTIKSGKVFKISSGGFNGSLTYFKLQNVIYENTAHTGLEIIRCYTFDANWNMKIIAYVDHYAPYRTEPSVAGPDGNHMKTISENTFNHIFNSIENLNDMLIVPSRNNSSGLSYSEVNKLLSDPNSMFVAGAKSTAYVNKNFVRDYIIELMSRI